jgi:RNA polymerase-binding transcription factor DksA
MDSEPSARRRLTAARAVAVARCASLRAQLARLLEDTADSGADDEHDIEGASVPFEREQLRATSRQAAEELAEIDAALARLADGTYGTCEVCGEPVGEQRLAVRPAARTCVRCAARPSRRRQSS